MAERGGGASQPAIHQDERCYLNVAIPRTGCNRTSMTDLTTLFMALTWPAALVISVLAISRTLIVVARSGIRVEIFTRQPILIGTGNAPLRAEVGKVRI